MTSPAPRSSEVALLAEAGDLDREERTAILAVWRAVEAGQVRDLFLLPPRPTHRDVKRAYYELSRKFHPDRFHGRALGSFEPMLGRIVAALSEYVRTLSDPRTVIGHPTRAPAYQARRHPRYPFAVPIALRCRSRGVVEQLETIDVGLGGVFVPTADPAPAGDVVELRLGVPGAPPVTLRGRVAFSRRPTSGLAPGGMGIEIPTDEGGDGNAAAQTMLRLVVLAQRAGVTPSSGPSAPPPAAPPRAAPRVRQARGSSAGVARVVGVDFGTSYTAVAAAVDGYVDVLPWPDGSFAAPSVVGFPAPGRWEVGVDAQETLERDPAHAIATVKRLLGRRLDDPDLAGLLAQAPFPVSATAAGDLCVRMWDRTFDVAQLVSLLLVGARQVAEHALGGPVAHAVATIPVSFTDERVALLKRAGRLAGLEIVEVIEEPSAAAFACRRTDEVDGLVGVYDFGGGTFDFSVVDASAGTPQVLATAGDSWLGGVDLDLALAEAVNRLVWKRHQVDLKGRPESWQTLLRSVERAKRQLSDVYRVDLIVPGVMPAGAGTHGRSSRRVDSAGADGARDLGLELRRDTVEPLFAPLIDRSLDTCVQALELSGLRPGDLSAVYLSGGTSYVPAVRRAIARRLGVPVKVGAPPEHAVVLGAGLVANQLARWAARGRGAA